MLRKKIFLFAITTLIIAVGIIACSNKSEGDKQAQSKTEINMAQVSINPHPASLEGKTVVLRWNSKLNGDKLLDRVAELLTQKVPGIKILKMYQVDPSTVVVADKMEDSLTIANKIMKYKPDLVIASSADCGHCSGALVIDQLNLEKKGIPTVTITTTAFEKLVKKTMVNQGVSEMAIVVVPHPIAGRNLSETNQLVDGVFNDIINAATQWQPAK